MEVWLAVAVGLLCGSFTNVLIVRIPQGTDWVRDTSKCTSCEQPISWWDNIPVLSWLILRGRCRRCSAKISIRYPLVELLVAALFGGIAWVYGVHVSSVLLAVLAVTLTALMFIDMEHMRLPDKLVWPSLAAAIGFALALSVESGDWGTVLRAVVGLAAMGGAYFLLWFAYPRGLGFGDVKLALPLGATLGALGWQALAVGALAGPIVGSVIAIIVMAAHRAVRGVKMPYGPAMIVAFWIGVCVGEPVADAYIAWSLSW